LWSRASRSAPCHASRAQAPEQRVSDLRHPVGDRLELGGAVVAVDLFQQHDQGINLLGFDRHDDDHGLRLLVSRQHQQVVQLSTGGKARVAVGIAATI